MDEVIRAEGLAKRFDDHAALQGLDLSIHRGALYGLVGPNGAGKTTLIRILCGLLTADAGTAWVLGWKVPSFRVRSQIGYMPQGIALYADLTVRQNLTFFGELYDLPRRTLTERVDEVLSLVQLLDRADQPVGGLAGGMQRRVSLALSLLHKPQLLFLDEPTVGVDPRMRHAFWEHFEALASQEVTLLITTHIMDEAAHCRTIGFLNQGRLLTQGAPDDILERTGADSLEGAYTTLEAMEAA
jgi:ABC-2 type transport system ATP-binding protein